MRTATCARPFVGVSQLSKDCEEWHCGATESRRLWLLTNCNYLSSNWLTKQVEVAPGLLKMYLLELNVCSEILFSGIVKSNEEMEMVKIVFDLLR